MRTWPPGVSWYSSERAQLIASGPQRGTVTAMVPPGRSTRASSRMAATSSGMCSRTSEAMTRSKVASGNGRASASPCTAVAGMVGRQLPRLHHGAPTCRAPAPPLRARHRARPRPRRAGPPRTRAGRIRNRGRETVARLHAELVVVHRQHATSPSPARAAGAPGCARARRPRQRLPRQQGLVAGRRAGRGHLPGEAVDHPFAAGRSQAGPQGGVVEEARDGAGQCPGIVGGNQQAGLPVDAHDFGQRTPGGGDHGHAAGHRLDGRQGEPLVQRGHDGDLGLPVQAGQRVVAYPADALHDVGEPEPGDGLVDPAALCGPPDDGERRRRARCASLATASRRGTSPFMGTSLDEVTMIRPGSA